MCSFLETAQQLCSMQVLRDTDEVAVLLRVGASLCGGQSFLWASIRKTLMEAADGKQLMENSSHLDQEHRTLL